MSLNPIFIAAIIKTVRAYHETEWEIFIREWMSGFGNSYLQVQKIGGTDDHGRDVVGFTDAKKYQGVWDNCQCKHYAKPIPTNVAVLDIGKIIFHSFDGSFLPPRRSDFFGPLGVSTSLELLLGNPDKLKNHIVYTWDQTCSKAITKTKQLPLIGALKHYVEAFDFSIFGWKTIDEVLDGHRKTAHWTQRFGGLLPKPQAGVVPASLQAIESRYMRHILDAYEERLGIPLASDIAVQDVALKQDMHSHRERFFSAEAFILTYRDQTEPGTIEDFQSEIYDSVSPVLLAAHNDGVERLSAVMQQAAATSPANILAQQAKVRVKQGVCHQLANIDKLHWKTK